MEAVAEQLETLEQVHHMQVINHDMAYIITTVLDESTQRT